MITIIIADNFKKGMKSQGCVGLLPFKKRSNLLEQQKKIINKVFPQTDIYYIYGFDAKRLNSYISNNDGIHYVYNQYYETVGQAYGLGLLQKQLSKHDECLLLLGYDPIKEDHLKSLKKSKKSSSVVDPDNETKLGCILYKDNNIQHIFFDLENPICDMYLLKQKETSVLCDILKEKNTQSMFLFEIINSIIHRGGEFNAVSTKQKVKNEI
jgi:hypothetical protein